MACRHCQHDRPLVGRGLCSPCYQHLHQTDRAALLRYPRLTRAGRRLGGPRLTPEQVRAIRESPVKYSALARKFGVSESMICRIRAHRVYCDVV